jgi:hypothetical protein
MHAYTQLKADELAACKETTYGIIKRLFDNRQKNSTAIRTVHWGRGPDFEAILTPKNA